MTHDLFALWREDLGFGAPVYASDLRPFHPLGAFLPPSSIAAFALFLLGVVTIIFATRAFVARPSRARWLLLCAVVAVAITGCAPWGIVVSLVVAVVSMIVAAFQGDRRADRGAMAGGAFAVAIAVLLSAAWWMPLRAVRSIQTGPAKPLPRSHRSPEMFNTWFLWTLEPLVTARHAALLNYVFGPQQWFFVESFHVETGRQPFEKVLSSIPDFRKRATVDHVPWPLVEQKDFVARGQTTGGVVTAIERPRDGVRLDVQSRGWNLLVSNTPWWPGWRAYLRKARLRPVRVNGAFIGVFVPPGSGQIEFRYRPRELDQGLRFGLAGLLLAALSFAWPWYRRFAVNLPGGRVVTTRGRWPDLADIEGRLSVGFSRIRPRTATATLCVALFVYLVLLLAYASAAAGGADSSGYLNQARLWKTGRLIVPITIVDRLGLSHDFAPTFIPLGFAPGRESGMMVPTYPPGFPLQLALAEIVGGSRAIGAVVPISAAGSVALMFLLARMFGASRAWATAAATTLGLSSIVLFMALQPMTDVPAMFWSLATIVLIMKSANRRVLAVAAGAAFAVGVLVRPTNILLLPAALLLLRRRDIGAFVLGGVPFAIFQLATNEALFGNPLTSGYGSVRGMLTLPNFAERLSHYLQWLSVLFPIFFPLGLLGLTVRDVSARVRLALFAWFATFFLFYCFYSVYEAWWYTRFLLPAVPPIILLLCIAGERAGRRYPAVGTAAAIAVLVLVTAINIPLIRWFDPFDTAPGEAVYPESIRKFRPHLREDGVIVATQMTGAILYYTGQTAARLDSLDLTRFEQIRRAAAARGIPIHAILSGDELPGLGRRAPGNWAVVDQFRHVTLLRLRGPSLATSN